MIVPLPLPRRSEGLRERPVWVCREADGSVDAGTTWPMLVSLSGNVAGVPELELVAAVSTAPFSGGFSRSSVAGGRDASLSPVAGAVAGTVVVVGAVPAVSGIKPASPVSTTASGAFVSSGTFESSDSTGIGPATAFFTFVAAALAFDAMPPDEDSGFAAGSFDLLLARLLAAGAVAADSFGGGLLRSSTISWRLNVFEEKQLSAYGHALLCARFAYFLTN